MVEISYTAIVATISAIWVLVRVICCARSSRVSIKKELQLILVYICIVVVARFTFFPFSKVNGKIQPLIFDSNRVFPFRINLVPFANLLDYPRFSEAMVNLIGNTAMFIPIGVIWPGVYKELNTHKKAILAGVCFSLCIEILQLPFFDRVTDIDDLVLNSSGYLVGYGIYLLAKALKAKALKKRKSA